MKCKNCGAGEDRLQMVSMGSYFQVTCTACGSGFGTSKEETEEAAAIVRQRQMTRLEEIQAARARSKETTDNQSSPQTADDQG